MSQDAKAEGSGNIIVQAAGDGIHVDVNVPHLTIVPPRNLIPSAPPRNEVDLLNPYRRTISLVGREADMQSLWNWLHSPRSIAIRTLTGRAGAGKTRAAIELIEQLNQEKKDQWWTGFVSGREVRRFAAQQNLADWGWALPTLIVVDYAASLVEPLREWLRELSQNAARSGGIPLRLLLLEREAAAESGWLQFLTFGGQSEARLIELFDPLEPKRLDLLESIEKRRAVLAKMLETAATLTQSKLPKLPAHGQNPRFDKQLENAEWEDPLYLMMAALLSLRSDMVEVLQLPRTELALQLVDHEIKRLTEGAPTRDAERLMLHLTAFAALGNGLTHEQALQIAGQECAALQLCYPGDSGALVDRVHEILPAPNHAIAPVVPDILAEALVLRAMSRCSAGEQDAGILRAVKKFGPRAVPFIVRTVQDFAPAGEATPLNWLESLIKAGLADDLGLLLEIESAIPLRTLALREKAVELDELLVERLAGLMTDAPSEARLAERARLVSNLSFRLHSLGRLQKSLARAREAVLLREQLVKARPDVHLPQLAGSLNNLANALREQGQHGEALARAEEASQIFQQLSDARPDEFLAEFAMSLNNLANKLGDLGRDEEALAKAEGAVQLLRELASARPNDFLPNLAMSLNNLAMRLGEMGRGTEALARAQEAVRIREQLRFLRFDGEGFPR